MSDIILYTSEDGRTRMNLRVEGETVWLTQGEIAELFQTTKQNVSLHARNILEDKELRAEATVKESLTVQTEGNRQVERRITLYNLDLILAIGFRVRSPRGTQFRQWATTHLREFVVKGFAIDDERLKGTGRWDYFDELLARIRDIRASEKRFYQKVRELFSLSSDYKVTEPETHQFFAEVQNKLLFAATGHTAAEIIVGRSDPAKPNMNLTAWDGQRVRKQDVIIAKNYLSADEVDTLNRLVVIFLEQAELRVKERKDLTLDFWRANVDKMIAFNERPLLKGPGSVSHDRMKEIAHERYEAFDAGRRAAEASAADQADARELREIEELDKKITRSKKRPKGGEK
ncbi:MAG: virulence RhuM family protein [Phycisphaeraceae bacterium]|nr:virulence RhuM family protein [Phycisphaeraceae bacterium]